MAESLGASQTTLHLKNRTGFSLHGDDCETDARKRKGITNERKGKYDRDSCRTYVSLHHHSTYSFLDGYALPDAHIRRATEIGMGSLALTEHGNISSWVKLEKAGLEQGVKPIFGCELYTGPTNEHRSQRKYHLTVLAMNQTGVMNLMALVTRAWENFYYEPTTSFADLKAFGDGLIILSGCTGSLLACSAVGGKLIPPELASYERARSVARTFQREFGDRYYLEVQAFPELDNVRTLNRMYERLGKELGIRLVGTGDVHYTVPKESEMQQILHNVRGGNKKTLEEQAREWGYDVMLAPPTSDAYMLRRLRATGLSMHAAAEALHSTAEIAGRCNVTLPKMADLKFPIPEPYTTTEEVWQGWLTEGWKYRKVASKANVGEYVARLHYERKIIEDKGFQDYFLTVSDVVKFAKDSGIPVGPARGSAAASLVAWLLRITEVDPLSFPNLLFERFIEPTRKDLPDIDLDFDDTRRWEIRQYLVSKYGEDQVGNIGTVTNYKSKLALDDVARVYRIPKYAVEGVKDLLIERSSGDLRANATIEDTAEQFEAAAEIFKAWPDLAKATKLEGQIKGVGVHAAGLVVSSGPLTNTAATYTRKVGKVKREVKVLSVDKYDADHLNVLKIDVLGLTTMGMIARCLAMINKPLEWLYDIPLDDPVTIKGFKENDVVGIFQFDGRAMRGVTAELRPDTFLEVCDITALARPGPLHNGAAAEYIDVKQGRKQPRQYHPLVADIVNYTNGQIVYQEQILRVCGEIGGFDHVHRAVIRKIISKKLGEQEFNRWWEEFRDGALARGVNEADAHDIWMACITAGSYAFNVAHATSYGMLAWWTMYLKRHHTVEFFAASLAAYGKNKQLELLRDATRHNVKILPPSLADSTMEWSIGKVGTEKCVIAGFSQVKTIGDVVGQKIVDWRDKKVQEGLFPEDWSAITEIPGVGPAKVKALEEFGNTDDPFEIFKLERAVGDIRDWIRRNPRSRVPRLTHRSVDVPYQRSGKDEEVVWSGIIVKRNLKELFELHFSRTGQELDPETVKDPDLNEWVVMWGDDGTDMLTITCNRWRYPDMRDKIWGIKDTDMVVVRGWKKGYESRRAIQIKDMWVFDMSDDKEEGGEDE